MDLHTLPAQFARQTQVNPYRKSVRLASKKRAFQKSSPGEIVLKKQASRNLPSRAIAQKVRQSLEQLQKSAEKHLQSQKTPPESPLKVGAKRDFPEQENGTESPKKVVRQARDIYKDVLNRKKAQQQSYLQSERESFLKPSRAFIEKLSTVISFLAEQTMTTVEKIPVVEVGDNQGFIVRGLRDYYLDNPNERIANCLGYHVILPNEQKREWEGLPRGEKMGITCSSWELELPLKGYLKNKPYVSYNGKGFAIFILHNYSEFIKPTTPVLLEERLAESCNQGAKLVIEGTKKLEDCRAGGAWRRRYYGSFEALRPTMEPIRDFQLKKRVRIDSYNKAFVIPDLSEELGEADQRAAQVVKARLFDELGTRPLNRNVALAMVPFSQGQQDLIYQRISRLAVKQIKGYALSDKEKTQLKALLETCSQSWKSKTKRASGKQQEVTLDFSFLEEVSSFTNADEIDPIVQFQEEITRRKQVEEVFNFVVQALRGLWQALPSEEKVWKYDSPQKFRETLEETFSARQGGPVDDDQFALLLNLFKFSYYHLVQERRFTKIWGKSH